MWIYCLLFFLCVHVCVCAVTDFSGEDKASGVKFCTAVYGHPGQGISHFGESSLLPQKPKIYIYFRPSLIDHGIGGAGVCTGHAQDRHVWIYGYPRRRTYLFLRFNATKTWGWFVWLIVALWTSDVGVGGCVGTWGWFVWLVVALWRRWYCDVPSTSFNSHTTSCPLQLTLWLIMMMIMMMMLVAWR